MHLKIKHPTLSLAQSHHHIHGKPLHSPHSSLSKARSNSSPHIKPQTTYKSILLPIHPSVPFPSLKARPERHQRHHLSILRARSLEVAIANFTFRQVYCCVRSFIPHPTICTLNALRSETRKKTEKKHRKGKCFHDSLTNKQQSQPAPDRTFISCVRSFRSW